MSLEFEKTAYVTISAEEVIAKWTPEEVAEFACAVAEKFDQDFKNRSDIAKNFADSLSENGCRFLAEVVTQHYARRK